MEPHITKQLLPALFARPHLYVNNGDWELRYPLTRGLDKFLLNGSFVTTPFSLGAKAAPAPF